MSRGNPLGYREPSGHQTCKDSDDCESRERNTPVATTYNYNSFIPPISDGGMQTQGYFLATRVGDSQHVGVDTAQKSDSTIRASGNGIVVLADACSESECIGMIGQFIPTNNNGYGNVVVVEYPYLSLPEAVRKDLNLERGQSLFMPYAHLKDAPTLKPGSFVKTGQTLGTIGSTGNSAGSHLHHETQVAKTDALARGVMCSDSSCFATKKDGSPQYGTWREFPKFDPNTITYSVNPKARSLKVAD